MFLSFQEFLSYYGKTINMINEIECKQEYLYLYMQYCKDYHVCDNLYDVFKELQYLV